MQNDYQPGEDLTITIAHIKHNIKVLAVIHKQAQALLDKPIEALYAAKSKPGRASTPPPSLCPRPG